MLFTSPQLYELASVNMDNGGITIANASTINVIYVIITYYKC